MTIEEFTKNVQDELGEKMLTTYQLEVVLHHVGELFLQNKTSTSDNVRTEVLIRYYGLGPEDMENDISYYE